MSCWRWQNNWLGNFIIKKIAISLASQLDLFPGTKKVGDKYNNGNNYDGWRIGYLDDSREHGIAFRIYSNHLEGPVSEAPSYNQLLLLYQNRSVLGLYNEYWTGDCWSKKITYSDGSSHFDRYCYTLDFTTGTKNTRKCHDVEYTAIGIKNFWL